MKILVDIDKEVYKAIKSPLDSGGYYDSKCYDAIWNGVPLPKGHGRLGDLSKIYVELNEAQVEGTEEYKGLGEAKQIICNAPTIIEADTESEVEE